MNDVYEHWRQTQPLLRSNRAGVRWLSHRLWTRREESPGQSEVGGIAAKTSLDQLFVQYKCTVMDDINGHYLQLPLFSLQGFPLYEAHQIGRATTGGLLLWSRGGLVIDTTALEELRLSAVFLISDKVYYNNNKKAIK